MNVKRLLVGAAGLAVVALMPFVVGIAYLKFNEPELVFQAGLSRPWHAGFIGTPPVEATKVRIALPDGGSLHGYTLAASPERDHGYWVLHLHGNADSAFSQGQLRNMLRIAAEGLSVLAFDYRGFGASGGTPSEQGIYEDADAAWRWLVSQGVPPERIVIWGHSLGSGPATKLGSEVRSAAVVLFGAFTSVPDRGAELYPWLPIRWIAGIRFDSLARMPMLKAPVVIAHGETDVTIPIWHAERLYAAAAEPKRLLRLKMQQDDGLGGHVTALYDQLGLLMPLLRELAGMPAHTGAR